MMAGRTLRAAFVLAAVSSGAARSAASAAGDSPPWFEVRIPEGAARLAQAAGLDPATDAWRLLPDLTRRLHVTYGERAAARVAPQLAAYFAGASVAASPEVVPPVADGDGTPVLLVPAEPHVPASAPTLRAPRRRGPRVAAPLPRRLGSDPRARSQGTAARHPERDRRGRRGGPALPRPLHAGRAHAGRPVGGERPAHDLPAAHGCLRDLRRQLPRRRRTRPGAGRRRPGRRVAGPRGRVGDAPEGLPRAARRRRPGTPLLPLRHHRPSRRSAPPFRAGRHRA